MSLRSCREIIRAAFGLQTSNEQLIRTHQTDCVGRHRHMRPGIFGKTVIFEQTVITVP